LLPTIKRNEPSEFLPKHGKLFSPFYILHTAINSSTMTPFVQQTAGATKARDAARD